MPTLTRQIIKDVVSEEVGSATNEIRTNKSLEQKLALNKSLDKVDLV